MLKAVVEVKVLLCRASNAACEPEITFPYLGYKNSQLVFIPISLA